MINPNKLYSSGIVGIVTKLITNAPGYWFEVDLDGNRFEGFLREGEPNYQKLVVGDKVHCGAQFSITGDCFLIRSIRKVK